MQIVLLVLVCTSLINVLYAKDIVNHYISILGLYSFLVVFIANAIEEPQPIIILITIIYAILNQILISINENLKNDRKEIEEVV